MNWGTRTQIFWGQRLKYLRQRLKYFEGLKWGSVYWYARESAISRNDIKTWNGTFPPHCSTSFVCLIFKFMVIFDFGCDHVRKQIKQRENENTENNQVEIKKQTQ